jgi:hypothetical protein
LRRKRKEIKNNVNEKWEDKNKTENGTRRQVCKEGNKKTNVNF